MLFFLAIYLNFFSASAATTPVPELDLARYMGKWYEVASIPQRFSRGCVCTRASYSLKPNGRVAVSNTCNDVTPQGKLRQAVGTAKAADPAVNAKLKVSFFWPFYADYWVIGLADDYRYAVVSNEEGDTLWILSRTPSMLPADYQSALAIAEQNGVDTERLLITEQAGCVYPGP